MFKLLFVLLIAAGAFAQDAPPPKPTDAKPPTIGSLDEKETKSFRRFDRDGDGKITVEEYRNSVVRIFTRLDKKKRGYLDQSEAPKTAKGPKDRITLPEFQDAMMVRFRKADADHDGLLTPDEFKIWRQAMNP